MSVCTFIASDFPLPVVVPPNVYPLHINIDDGTIDDGGADDNYSLQAFPEAENYTEKKYGTRLEWNYTAGRAKRIIAYVKTALQNTTSVELWHVWLMDYYEFEDRPVLYKKTVSIDSLTPEHIRQMDNAQIWNAPDKQYPGRPSFYCLTITR